MPSLKYPKPEPRKTAKARAKRDDVKKLQAWRDAVWLRENQKAAFSLDFAFCQRCHALVTRAEGYSLTGECHHRVGRRAKATRYDPANGVLLCNFRLNACHERVTRHEIPCP